MEVKLDISELERLVADLSKNSSISANVGVLDTPSSDGGASTAEYATYFEYGWVQKVTGKQSKWLEANSGIKVKIGSTLYNPPRPFFRYTIEDEHKIWEKLFKSALEHYVSVSGVSEGYLQSLRLVATKAAEDVRETLINGGSKTHKFPPRSPLTMAIYRSLNGNHESDGTGSTVTTKPGIYSMTLHDSISFEIG